MSATYDPETSWPMISCDVPGCPVIGGHAKAITATDVRRLIKPEGWFSIPGHDLCPYHAKSRKG